MTGRFAIRSAYAVSVGGEGRTDDVGDHHRAAIVGAGYATGMWGKWHPGGASPDAHKSGFDEWYGIPRTYDEAMWPSLDETKAWPSVGDKGLGTRSFT
jgi:arylsulfatase